jgi:hypothetical protein
VATDLKNREQQTTCEIEAEKHCAPTLRYRAHSLGKTPDGLGLIPQGVGRRALRQAHGCPWECRSTRVINSRSTVSTSLWQIPFSPALSMVSIVPTRSRSAGRESFLETVAKLGFPAASKGNKLQIEFDALERRMVGFDRDVGWFLSEVVDRR